MTSTQPQPEKVEQLALKMAEAILEEYPLRPSDTAVTNSCPYAALIVRAGEELRLRGRCSGLSEHATCERCALLRDIEAVMEESPEVKRG